MTDLWPDGTAILPWEREALAHLASREDAIVFVCGRICDDANRHARPFIRRARQAGINADLRNARLTCGGGNYGELHGTLAFGKRAKVVYP